MSIYQMNNSANIVFIQTESQDGRLLGSMGHPAMADATPNLDRLAAAGVMFENNYCNFPVCCPSRASMWSGRFPHKIDAWNNYNGLAPETPTFISRLEAGGYKTAIFGRTDHLSGSHSQTARIGAWTREAAIPRPVHGEGRKPRIEIEPVTRMHEKDWQIVDQGCAWLQKNDPAKQTPFMLYLGFHSVHHPFATSSYYLEQIPESKINLPPLDQLNHPLPPLQRRQKNWGHAIDPDEMRLRRRIYFAMIAEIDAMVGTVLDALEASGASDNTWVAFTSDHGEMAGEHQQYIKLTHFEASARVPLIIRGPTAQAGQRIAAPSSLIDLHPTFLDLAGMNIPNQCDGYSLVPELTGKPTRRPPRAFAEHHSTTCPTGSFMLRRENWKYIAYPDYPPLLFNLNEDPDELQDAAKRCPDVVNAMDAELGSIVDYKAVDARAKAEDRTQFSNWRENALRDGNYHETMAKVYSGKHYPPRDPEPWRDEDEERIRQWLAGDRPPLPNLDGSLN